MRILLTRKMRRPFTIFLIALFSLLAFLTYKVTPLIALLFEDVSNDLIPKAEVDVDASPDFRNRPALIPKIIHQTYKTAEIPEKWLRPQKECRDLHPEYEYKVSRVSSAFCVKG